MGGWRKEECFSVYTVLYDFGNPLIEGPGSPDGAWRKILRAALPAGNSKLGERSYVDIVL